MWPGSNVRNREPSVASRDCCHFLFSGRRVYCYLRSGHRFTGSRAYDTGPRWRRRRTLLCFKRDRDHQSQQQTSFYQLEGLMKGSSYCVFLCVAEFIYDKFPRVKTECNREHEGLQRKRRLPARARIVRRCQEQAETIERPTASVYVLVTSMPWER